MTYTFRCPKCRKKYDIRESMVNIEKLNPLCPKCEVSMTREYNAPGIHYKGDGWTKKAVDKK